MPDFKKMSKSLCYVTISPDPAHKVHGKRFDLCEIPVQIARIHKAIQQSLKFCKQDKVLVYYELNTRHLAHAHFELMLSDRDYNDFRARIAIRLTRGLHSPDICCNICPWHRWKPKHNPETGKPYESWEEYCKKDPS